MLTGRNAAIFAGLVGAALAFNGFGVAGAIFMLAALAVFALAPHSDAPRDEWDPELQTYEDWLEERNSRRN